MGMNREFDFQCHLETRGRNKEWEGGLTERFAFVCSFEICFFFDM